MKDVGLDPDHTIQALTAKIRHFAEERQWEPFHTPRNLMLALVGEVGELAEIFQWRKEEEVATMMSDAATAQALRDELADVATYCFRLADVLGIDLGAAMVQKIAQNAAKYPVEKAKGHARKYTDL